MKETKKSKIKEVLIKYFEKENHEFFASDLVTHVRNRTGLFYIFEDTIRRYRDELREDGLINFKCINKSKALYRSLKI